LAESVVRETKSHYLIYLLDTTT